MVAGAKQFYLWQSNKKPSDHGFIEDARANNNLGRSIIALILKKEKIRIEEGKGFIFELCLCLHMRKKIYKLTWIKV